MERYDRKNISGSSRWGVGYAVIPENVSDLGEDKIEYEGIIFPYREMIGKLKGDEK